MEGPPNLEESDDESDMEDDDAEESDNDMDRLAACMEESSDEEDTEEDKDTEALCDLIAALGGEPGEVPQAGGQKSQEHGV